MSRTLLWLLATLAFTSLISRTDGSELKVMSAPNLLRVGTIENIFVECQDCSGADKEVRITVMNFPTKSSRLASTSVTLTSAQHFQGIGQIQIPAEVFSRDSTRKQYVYLQAHFPDKILEKVVLVSFHSGYIFIQTDKTLYTPNSRVHYRIFAVTPGMEPVERNSSIDIEIKTPEDITFPVGTVSLNSGIHPGSYQLADIVSTGIWNVVAKFHSNPQQTFSAEFEVKEYVLPSFEVKLISLSSFFYVDSATLTINIQAKYLFGAEVDGTAFAVFGVVHEGQKKSFPDSVQKVEIAEGEGEVILKKEHITQNFNIDDLVGSSIFVAVSVLAENGGEMVEAELRSIQIVTSPYSILFKKTPKYFKPGMPLNVEVEVMNPDQTPADNILVLVGPGNEHAVPTGPNGIAKTTVNTNDGAASLTITATTADPDIPLEKQASATMEALPYKSIGNNYIHIDVDTAEKNLKITLSFNRQQTMERIRTDITYLILSRSQLVSYGRFTKENQNLISLMVPITKEMLPSVRIIAYYHTNTNEVVSDSVWVDVKDTCMGSLKLEPKGNENTYKPRSWFHLKVTGDPGATVGLVAVDKGVYVLNNKFRLTQKKVWDFVEKYDTGCTPGGGKDNMGVFYDAGLLFESSSGGTPYRQELNCPKEAPKRRKRSDTIMSVRTSLLSQYKTEQRECCLDGMRETPLSYSCERRSQYITDGQACVDAFLNCCNSILTHQTERRDEELHLARSEADDGNTMDINEVVSRTQFPESWLWSDIKLGSCPPNTRSCKTMSKDKNVPLPDSITTWQLTGISLSSYYGICVSEPLEVIVSKDFFIDLRLPYSAVRGEQLEIKAILHNYSPKSVTVRVDLLEEEHVCSSASKRSKYRQQVNVFPNSPRSVPFVIIPMKEGIVNIEVKAVVLKNPGLYDGVRKQLRVLPEGVLIKSPTILTLDPVKNGTNGKQVEIINSGIQRKDLVPNTPTSTQISVIGREQIGAVVEDAISGQSMGNMIYQPSGCGEQNMIHMTMPVIATLYLDKTSQWETVGFQKRDEALKHISYGYQMELAYCKSDGSFAAFPKHQSSSWLTAYVAKVFAMANTLVAVKKNVICGAVKYVILNGQRPDGMFKEDGTVIHGEMMGDVRGGADSDASMTAFCLIALQETRTLCSDTVDSLQGSIDKAVTYLEKCLPKLNNPYAVAIASYALANEDKFNKEILYRFVTESTYWRVPRGHVYTMEATGYALLALVRAKALEEARPVVRWLNKQQRVGGGYGSTQATIIVYQAVAEYWAIAKEPEYDLNVDILVQGRSKPYSYNFNSGNHNATRTSHISDINQNVTVTATGTGEATVMLVSLYYAIPKEKESDCRKFNLSVQLIPEQDNEEEEVYRLKIEYLYKDEERDAGMSVLDIGLLTGFTVDTNDLNRLAKGPSRTISRYEMDKTLSERGSLIIYLKSVSHTQTEEVAFRIHQTLKVGVLQPAAVSIYEYYEQKHCVKFYHPERTAGHLMRLCRNDECICAEENCSMQKKENINNDQRIAKSCESTPTSKIDYVYKVRVENFTNGVSTDSYAMLVLESIKEGTLDVGPRGKSRIFLGYARCKEALDLRVGNTYLIMGTSKDIHRDTESKTFQYVLGERTWVEYWPTDEECQNEEHRNTCFGMQEIQRPQLQICHE